MIRIHPLRACTAAALAIIPLLAACTTSSGAPASAAIPAAEAVANGLRIAEQYRVGAITTRRFTHEAFWRAIEHSISTPALRTQEIGRSLLGREIRSVTYGEGNTTVLLWSQMHGDESTATMALADLFRFLAEATVAPHRRCGRHRHSPRCQPDERAGADDRRAPGALTVIFSR